MKISGQCIMPGGGIIQMLHDVLNKSGADPLLLPIANCTEKGSP